ncbi:MAG: FtsW/RodA/SpoVE family cell cycle protein [Muribaculaceae bacterium]|nr:FtsW/RodA/SpoVE family cell cycle protein [Muribaculaceae bacterium]
METAAKPTAIAEEKPKRTDRQIWGIYIALCLISIVELYSASSHEVTAANVLSPVIRHVVFLGIGLVLILLLQRTHYKKFYRWSWVFATISVLAMVWTLFFGITINGAQRAFSILGFTIQPSEMVKLSSALMIAAILCKEQMKGVDDVTDKGVIYSTAVVLVCCGLLFSQGLTNTILLMAISLSMMVIGGVGGKKLLKVLLVFLVAGCIGMGVKLLRASGSSEEVKVEQVITTVPGTDVKVGVSDADKGFGNEGGRLDTWINRVSRFLKSDKYTETITNENRQEQYSYIAQAHGGMFGVMPGNSRETARLPLAFSDYIYAIVIEELGLFGGIFVLVLYLWLLARAGRVASRCQTAFPALLVIGMAVFIAYQAIFHMAIVTGVFPVSGQPLPLISKGGTSILMTSIAIGVMLSVSRHAARKGKKAEIKEELSELSEEINAINPT